MYDAAGVRRHAGTQAEVLNLVVQELLHKHAISQRKLKEVLGHTPLQVRLSRCSASVYSQLHAFPSGMQYMHVTSCAWAGIFRHGFLLQRRQTMYGAVAWSALNRRIVPLCAGQWPQKIM